MSGAQKAFNSLASIPYVGYALGLAASAATIAAGVYRVNEIRKQQFASGGLNRMGGWSLTGEMGPELQYMPAGTQVINHHKTNQIINNSGKGTTIHVTVNNSTGIKQDEFVRDLRNGSMDYVVKKLAEKMGVK